jgi:pimeloyl-ACP methyl ester carboxylesterase
MLRLLESYLTFHPDTIDHGGLSDVPHQRIRFGAEFGLDLDGAWIPGSSEQVVLFNHGNRHNLTKFKEHYQLFKELGFNCLSYDYPGYGQSAGAPSEAALYASARAAYSHLTNDIGVDPRCVTIYGCSLGGAVAIELASHTPAAALITESTFTNSHEIAKHLYPFLPVYHLLPKRFNNDSLITTITTRKLIIHGEQDLRVPVSMAKALAKRALDPYKIELIPDAGHIDCLTKGGERLSELIRDFVAN